MRRQSPSSPGNVRALAGRRREPGGEHDRQAGLGARTGVGGGLLERLVHGDAREAGIRERRGESRRGGPEERGVRAGASADLRSAREEIALLRRGVHRAAAEVVVAAGDQDDRAGRVQREAGGRLGGRRGEHVADHVASRRRSPRRSRRIARPCQPASARAIAPGGGSREQRARAGEQSVLRTGRGRQGGDRPEVVRRAREPRPSGARLDAGARIVRRPGERHRQDARGRCRDASSTAPGSSAFTTTQSSGRLELDDAPLGGDVGGEAAVLVDVIGPDVRDAGDRAGWPSRRRGGSR